MDQFLGRHHGGLHARHILADARGSRFEVRLVAVDDVGAFHRAGVIGEADRAEHPLAAMLIDRHGHAG